MNRRPPQPALTQRIVNALTYPEQKSGNGSHLVPDGILNRLYLRVLPSDSKVFVIRFYRGTKRMQRTLGRHPELTLERARMLALGMLERIDQGEDPDPSELDLADVGGQRPTKIPSLREFYESYDAEHISRNRAAREHRRLFERHILPEFGALRLDAIKRAHCARLHLRLADTPYEANRVREQLSSLFNKAVEWEVLPEGHPNPVRYVRRYPEEPRTRVLTIEESARLYRAVDCIDAEHTRAFFRVLMDVPLRKSELLRARWDELDVDAGTLRVKSTNRIKRVGTHSLTPEVVDLLASLPRLVGNPYIFPSRDGKSHLKDVDSQWKRIRTAAGTPGVRMHDLRRTIATNYASDGLNELEIQQLLGHTTSVASRHYVHLAENRRQREFALVRAELRRAALQRLESQENLQLSIPADS